MVPLVQMPGNPFVHRPVSLGQPLPLAPTPPNNAVSPHLVGAGISLLGLLIGIVGYHYHKDPLGQIMLGAGGSMVGAGIVLVGLNLAGLQSSWTVP